MEAPSAPSPAGPGLAGVRRGYVWAPSAISKHPGRQPVGVRAVQCVWVGVRVCVCVCVRACVCVCVRSCVLRSPESFRVVRVFRTGTSSEPRL